MTEDFDKEFSHSDECATLRFADFEKEPFADCYCQLKDIKTFLHQERSLLLSELRNKLEGEKAKIFIDYPNTPDGNQARHENRLYIAGLDCAIQLTKEMEKG